jgi:hypothetical protein
MGKKKDKVEDEKKVTVTVNEHLTEMLKEHSDKKSDDIIEKKSS